MNLLAIESAGPYGGVALTDDRGLRGEMRFRDLRDYAEKLTPWIADLLRQLSVEPEQIDAVAVTVGPGSFTGVRVGVATAQGLAVALKIPLVPIDSLEACAFDTDPTDLPIAVVIDAGRGEICGQIFGWTPEGPVSQSPAEIFEPETFLKKLQPPFHLNGSGLPLLEEAAQKRFGDGVRFSENRWDGTSPSAVAALGLIRFRKNGGVKPHQVEPVYLRPTAVGKKVDKQKSVSPDKQSASPPSEPPLV
jgi:tRNA threonylcarbamoyladenosine biosynthesis protein TsaB